MVKYPSMNHRRPWHSDPAEEGKGMMVPGSNWESPVKSHQCHIVLATNKASFKTLLWLRGSIWTMYMWTFSSPTKYGHIMPFSFQRLQICEPEISSHDVCYCLLQPVVCGSFLLQGSRLKKSVQNWYLSLGSVDTSHKPNKGRLGWQYFWKHNFWVEQVLFVLGFQFTSQSRGIPNFQWSSFKMRFSPIFRKWPGCFFWWPVWRWQGRGGGSRWTRRWRAWKKEMWRAWMGERGEDWLTGLDGGAAKPLRPQSEGSRAFRGGPAKLRCKKIKFGVRVRVDQDSRLIFTFLSCAGKLPRASTAKNISQQQKQTET